MSDPQPKPSSAPGNTKPAMRPPIPQPQTLFSPPIVRHAANAKLDRAAFTKTINLAAAAVREPRLLSDWRKKLQKGKELLHEPHIAAIQPLPETEVPAILDHFKAWHNAQTPPTPLNPPSTSALKCLLLAPTTKASDPTTYGPLLCEALSTRAILTVFPFTLTLDYTHWDWNQLIFSILPPELHSEIPHGFNTAGHVAHLNLRSHHLPYARLIGEILLSKAGKGGIRTVINKTDEVGEASQFRTFSYDVLAGDDDLGVEVRKMGCLFRFDYGRVYWNSKLDSEHRRLVEGFESGEVVVDVMAGIGPFAVPAAKGGDGGGGSGVGGGCLVWANDVNPDSVRYLREAARINKVEHTLRVFNMDGKVFIPQSAVMVEEASEREGFVTMPGPKPKPVADNTKPTGSKAKEGGGAAGQRHKKPPPTITIPIPPTISHFIMNLPASALEFLPYFRGLYRGKEHLFLHTLPSTSYTTSPSHPHTTGAQKDGKTARKTTWKRKLPMLHVHCFATKRRYATHELGDGEVPFRDEILPRLKKCLGVSGMRRRIGEGVRAGGPVLEGVKGKEKMKEKGKKGESKEVQEQAEKDQDEDEGLVDIYDVRDVSPSKSMYCCSFRLPASVAFGERLSDEECVVVEESIRGKLEGEKDS